MVGNELMNAGNKKRNKSYWNVKVTASKSCYNATAMTLQSPYLEKLQKQVRTTTLL